MPQTDLDEDASPTGTFRRAATPGAELAALDRGIRQNRARASFIYRSQRAAIQGAASAAGGGELGRVTVEAPSSEVALEDHVEGLKEEGGQALDANVELVVLGSSDAQMYAAVRTESRPEQRVDLDLNVSLSGLDAYEATTLTRLMTNLRSFLAAARQENAEHRIQQLVQAIAPADPLAEIDLQVAAATIELRREFLEHVPVLSSAEVHKNAGFPAGNASQTVLRWRKAGKIFGISHGGRDLYPTFQFGPDGRPLPLIAEVLAILRRAEDVSDWDVALWFAGDTGWLDGKAPIDCLQSDPAAVRQAAEQEVLRDEY